MVWASGNSAPATRWGAAGSLRSDLTCRKSETGKGEPSSEVRRNSVSRGSFFPPRDSRRFTPPFCDCRADPQVDGARQLRVALAGSRVTRAPKCWLTRAAYLAAAFGDLVPKAELVQRSRLGGESQPKAHGKPTQGFPGRDSNGWAIKALGARYDVPKVSGLVRTRKCTVACAFVASASSQPEPPRFRPPRPSPMAS